MSMDPTPINCQTCGKETYKFHPAKKYCSLKCKKARLARRNGQVKRYKGSNKDVHQLSHRSPVSTHPNQLGAGTLKRGPKTSKLSNEINSPKQGVGTRKGVDFSLTQELYVKLVRKYGFVTEQHVKLLADLDIRIARGSIGKREFNGIASRMLKPARALERCRVAHPIDKEPRGSLKGDPEIIEVAKVGSGLSKVERAALGLWRPTY